MGIKTLDSNQARNHWRDLLDMALTDDTDVVITRYNKPIVAVVVYEDYLAVQEALRKRRAERRAQRRHMGEALATMIASEGVLAKEWDTPEEDEAWGRFVKGDVVVLPFPFSGLSASKKRPALILAPVQTHNDVILCMITSRQAKDASPLTP